VLLTRKTFQDVMGADLIAGIEEILGRTVLAFLAPTTSIPTSRSKRSSWPQTRSYPPPARKRAMTRGSFSRPEASARCAATPALTWRRSPDNSDEAARGGAAEGRRG